jgi:hypothetical protein
VFSLKNKGAVFDSAKYWERLKPPVGEDENEEDFIVSGDASGSYDALNNCVRHRQFNKRVVRCAHGGACCVFVRGVHLGECVYSCARAAGAHEAHDWR